MVVMHADTTITTVTLPSGMRLDLPADLVSEVAAALARDNTPDIEALEVLDDAMVAAEDTFGMHDIDDLLFGICTWAESA